MFRIGTVWRIMLRLLRLAARLQKVAGWIALRHHRLVTSSLVLTQSQAPVICQETLVKAVADP